MLYVFSGIKSTRSARKYINTSCRWGSNSVRSTNLTHEGTTEGREETLPEQILPPEEIFDDSTSNSSQQENSQIALTHVCVCMPC